jgi:hypothetical protein
MIAPVKTTTKYYVYSVDTTTGTTYQIETSPTWNGPGVKLAGPFATKAAAQAFIKANPDALNKAVLKQDQARVGYWVVVPEGELGDIVNALSTALNSNLLADAIGEIKGDLNPGSGDTYTITQLATATQVQNADTANLTLYSTKAAAQASADTLNVANGPKTGTGWEQSLENFLAAISSQNLWIRVAKVAIGGTLLIVGVAKMTGADVKIGGVVRKATKLAPLLLCHSRAHP